MVALVSEAIFSGGGVYGKQPAGLMIKALGRSPNAHICRFKIQRTKGGKRVGRNWMPNAGPPFVPQHYDQGFHPSGNSLAYCLQHAHLMGAKEVILMGFTFQAGSPYEFGRTNPVTRRPSFYNIEAPLEFCRWFERKWPGRAKLAKGWEGPLYEAGIFQVVDLTAPES